MQISFKLKLKQTYLSLKADLNKIWSCNPSLSLLVNQLPNNCSSKLKSVSENAQNLAFKQKSSHWFLSKL